MGSSSPDKTIFDEIRGKWVAATPEELIRQRLIKNLITHLGFPKSYLSIEKSLRELPHLALLEVADRRIDVVCFAKDIHPHFPLYPLLLIECKSVISKAARAQLLGYNHVVQAPFLALVSQEESLFGFYEGAQKKVSFLPYIPSYHSLLEAIPKWS